MPEKALIAMSGGVDSSVAAFLMRRQGFECVGVTLKLYENEDLGVPRERTCCSLDDIADARAVAARLGIPHYVFNFREEFLHCVVDRFVAAYEAGKTPNPCIDCNRCIKFAGLYQRMRALGFDRVVTGHYARTGIDEGSGRRLLLRARDPAKDQSYVLYHLTQEQLAHVAFPLGELTKPEVRALAEEEGFLNAKKHDSQDICFVPEGDYAAFIEQYTGKCYPDGDFIGREGEVLGRHRGLIRYTVGQRKGLGLSLPVPMYVTGKSVPDNTVSLGYDADLYSDRLTAREVNMIAWERLEEPTRLTAKVRYSQSARPATACSLPDGRLSVVFDEPQRAITPGQSVVLYDGDSVVGGGTIE